MKTTILTAGPHAKAANSWIPGRAELLCTLWDEPGEAFMKMKTRLSRWVRVEIAFIVPDWTWTSTRVTEDDR